MTYDDLMKDRPDLIARCIEMLKKQPFSRLETAVDPAARTITVSTTGLDQLDVELDGKQESSRPVTDAKTTVVSYPAGTKAIELVGLGKGTVRQRRRLSV